LARHGSSKGKKENRSPGQGSAQARDRSRSAEETRKETSSGKPPFFSVLEKSLPRSETGKEENTASPPKNNVRTLDASNGTVRVENYFPAEELEKLTVDEGICMFSRHNPERQKAALINVSRTEGGNVIAAVDGGLLVGYIGVHRPSERERWGKPGYGWLYELGAIEVSRNYRRIKLAENMLEAAFDDPFYDDKIVLTTGFTWHWDLEQTGMTKIQYHDMGVGLMSQYGFMEMATDEPNVTMDSANLFMVRIGNNASFSRYQKFASLLFANEWEAMLRGF
jgi:acetoin utilization protein AcuA